MVTRRSRSDSVFDIINTALMALFMLLMLYPLYFVIIVSLSDIKQVSLGNVFFFPKGFTIEAYRHVFYNKQIWTGYRNTIFYTVGGTLYQLVLMIPLAYAMSKQEMAGRKFFAWIYIITMYFSGGLMPSYLLTRNLGLIGNPLVMIVGGISAYNMIVTRTYFQTSVSRELLDASYIDGASEFRAFLRIVLPLSKPIIAVMALYSAVGQWNSYFSAMIYLTKPEHMPLQMILRDILISSKQMLMDERLLMTLSESERMSLERKAELAESMKYAVVFIGSAPLLMMYPFIQKYFAKGVMIGSLKG